MITVDGKKYYTWEDVVKIVMYVLENNITVEKSEDYIAKEQAKKLKEN